MAKVKKKSEISKENEKKIKNNSLIFNVLATETIFFNIQKKIN